jgi:hypothetical protein
MNLGLGEALISWIVTRSECTSSCIEWELQKTWMLGVVVVGGIYSPQPPRSRWGRLLAMGAPDSPVRHRTGPVHCPVHHHVTQPLGFGSSRPLALLSSCGTGQSGATPDRSCSLSGAPLTLRLWLCAHCSLLLLCQWLLQSTVARISRCSTGTLDSPVNYSGVRLRKPESGWFNPVWAWCTEHNPVAHRTVRCARPEHTWFLLLLQNGSLTWIFIGLCWTFLHL